MTERLTVAELRKLKRAPRSSSHRDKHLDQIRAALKADGMNVIDEFRFHHKRLWRFDIALPDYMIAIEYEGIAGGGRSRHTSVTGYTGDCEKYNEAQIIGWIVLRFTAKNIRTAGKVVRDAVEKVRGNAVISHRKAANFNSNTKAE